jgi:2-haloacid dehalogenase
MDRSDREAPATKTMIERPSGIRACVFDAYGTLFDVRNVAVGVMERTGVDSRAFFDIWRAKQLEYSWLRAVTGHHVDFWQVTRDALNYALESFGIADSTLGSAMMDAYLRIPIFPDVLPALEQLRASGLRRAILSNGTAHMLGAIVAHAGVTEHFEALLSVEEVGTFKPHPRVYALAPQRLSLPAEQICFVSSNGWDAWSARAFGFRVVWCNRRAQPRERLPSAPDGEIADLRDLSARINTFKKIA